MEGRSTSAGAGTQPSTIHASPLGFRLSRWVARDRRCSRVGRRRFPTRDRSSAACSSRNGQLPRHRGTGARVDKSLLLSILGPGAGMGLIYFGIRVTDLDQSMTFYVRGLGLEKLRGGRMPHGGRRVLLVDRGTGQRLELNWYPPGSPYAAPYVPGEGLDHLGFSTGRAAEVARRLEENGGRTVLRPSDPHGVRQNYYVEDPDGNWIELMAWGTRTSRSARRASAGRSTASARPRPAGG